MSNISIDFNNVGKMYRLGRVGTGTLSHDLNRWWTTTILGKEDPYLKIGETNDRSKKGNSDYVWALRDISFKVEQGDVVGIIGKNGAGKSTLLKLLSRITSPTTGTIRYQGRIASLLEVGTGFHPEMTGRENIYMNGSIMGMTKKEIDRKLDEIVDFAGVERYVDTPVKRYSSGMTVRLGFAVAAFLEPEILVVDEVLTVGDAEFQKKAIGKMNDVAHSEGRTVLFVSHNMAAVKNLCTRGVVLQNGQLVFDGTTEGAIDYYLKRNDIEFVESKIKDRITFKKPYIQIDLVTVNGAEKNMITIPANQPYMEFEIKGHSDMEFKTSIKALFSTLDDVVLATYSYGIYKGEIITFPAGDFSIKRRIELPKYLGTGDCYLSLLMYEPRIQDLVSIPDCVKVHFDGNCDEFCRPVNIKGEGFLGLE